MTFSLVALSPDRSELGVVTATKTPAVGSWVPALAPGVGALATQAHTNRGFRPLVLDALRRGLSAAEALQLARESDEDFALRQLGIVSATGECAAHTGDATTQWAGARVGEQFVVVGNYLVGSEVVDAMADAYSAAIERGDRFVDALVTALLAADETGGDRRGRQSAALLVASNSAVDEAPPELLFDLRIDDAADAPQALARLLAVSELKDLN